MSKVCYDEEQYFEISLGHLTSEIKKKKQGKSSLHAGQRGQNIILRLGAKGKSIPFSQDKTKIE